MPDFSKLQFPCGVCGHPASRHGPSGCSEPECPCEAIVDPCFDEPDEEEEPGEDDLDDLLALLSDEDG